jgi:AcrR family transcriptional regulator
MRRKTASSKHSATSSGATGAAASHRGKRAHIPKGAKGARRAASPDAPRKFPHQPRAQETVKAILQAAAELIAEQGYAGMTTNRIAERAGVSIGSLYQYFPNKSVILTRLLEEHIASVHPVVERSLDELADPEVRLSEALRRLFERLVDAHSGSPRLNHVLEEEVPRPPSVMEADRRQVEGFTRRTAEILNSRRDVHVPHPVIAASLFVVTSHALTRWLVHTAPAALDRKTCIDEAVRLLCGYVQEKRRSSA